MNTTTPLIEKLNWYIKFGATSEQVFFRDCLTTLQQAQEERERSEEALGYALAAIVHLNPEWSNTTGYAMAERVLMVLQERLGKPVSLPVVATTPAREEGEG